MSRAVGLAVALALAWPAAGLADAVDEQIAELANESNYKLRLASALALSRSGDARALRALASLLERASEKSLRRIAAAGLAKRAKAAPPALRAELLHILGKAAGRERDSKIRAVVVRIARELEQLAAKDAPVAEPDRAPPAVGSTAPAAGRVKDAPRLFVKVDPATDGTRKLGGDVLGAVSSAVRRSVTKAGFATTWPGALPTRAELVASASRGYSVAVAIKQVRVERPSSGGALISCSVSLMVAPWHGVDGKELWEADRAAAAAGSARAETGGSARDIAGGMRDCVEAVAAEVAERQVAPFLRRVATD